MNNTTMATLASPHHTFMSATAVFLRYGWGRTKGYQMLRSVGFPRPIGGAYRLDTLIAWEAAVLSGNPVSHGVHTEATTTPTTPAFPAAGPAPEPTTDPTEVELPRRNRTRGARRKDAA